MASGDGNGWVRCRCGHLHWGRFGAAGLALLAPTSIPMLMPKILLQLRAGWTHEGGSWGVPGGARDSHESVAEAALREAAEEAGTDSAHVTILSSLTGVDHVDWSYTYVLALAGADLRVGPPTAESEALRWVDLDEVATLTLHTGFGSTWPGLRSSICEALAGAGPAKD